MGGPGSGRKKGSVNGVTGSVKGAKKMPYDLGWTVKGRKSWVKRNPMMAKYGIQMVGPSDKIIRDPQFVPKKK